MASYTSTPAVTDFGQFQSLRAAAGRNDPKALREAARQFEALFTQMLLKEARRTQFGDDLTGEQGDFYRDMFDQQMALHLASGKGLGLADLLVQQLGGGAGAVPATSQSGFPRAAAVVTGAGQAERRESVSISPTTVDSPIAGKAASTTASAAGAVAAPDISDPGWQPRSREEFVAAIRPHAEKAAAELGVPARALIAQAALETGWGQRIGRGGDGINSFNLFNIKAGASWGGPELIRSSAEYGNGTWSSQSGSFRSYSSIGAAFDDYVRFLKNNPRYTEALNCADVQTFAQNLQSAGYATDPEYAQKLVRVACSAEMSGALGATQLARL